MSDDGARALPARGNAPRIASFAEFWPHYVLAHRKPLTRGLHYLGTTCAVASVLGAITARHWLPLLAAPLVGYGPAWIAHFMVEGNRPATFGHARYSLLADFKMLGLALRGQMAKEVRRLHGSSNEAQ